MDQEMIQKRYPRMVPLRGKDPNSGDPKDFQRVEKPDDHMRLNPEDYKTLLSEAPSVAMTIKQHIDKAIEKERLHHAADVEVAARQAVEGCARIAESFGGDGIRIANAIRGLPPLEENVPLLAQSAAGAVGSAGDGPDAGQLEGDVTYSEQTQVRQAEKAEKAANKNKVLK